MRVLAVSDLHVDHTANARWVESLSRQDFVGDALIVAGDVSDDLDRIARTLAALRERFAIVTYVPGNHELWVRNGQTDSLAKFWRVLERCDALDVATRPLRLSTGRHPVWLVPLFSWYVRPEEGRDSLYMPKPGDDPELSMWADLRRTAWHGFADGAAISAYFLSLNRSRVEATYDAPIVSFSHVLPRRELIPSSATLASPRRDPYPRFNFTRVAGSLGVERQLRALGSRVHVYGHQHRNRLRELDGVAYISHCLGYPRERHTGVLKFGGTPRSIWDTQTGAVR